MAAKEGIKGFFRRDNPRDNPRDNLKKWDNLIKI